MVAVLVWEAGLELLVWEDLVLLVLEAAGVWLQVFGAWEAGLVLLVLVLLVLEVVVVWQPVFGVWEVGAWQVAEA